MMHKNRQLYKQSNFNLPKIDEIEYTPFKRTKEKISNSKSEENIMINSGAQVKPTYGLAYNSEFQIIIGGENMYPLFMDVNDQNLVVCSQDFFLVIKIQVSEDLNAIKQNTTSFLKSNVKLGIYNKVVINQPPSCLYAAQNHIYLGMNDGKILCYDIGRKSLTGTCDTFELPIMQIKGVSQNQVIAIDCAGNLRYVEFSHKTFMDKIIKTLVSSKDISIQFKTLKREKFKKLFTGVMSKKEQNQTKNQEPKAESSKHGSQVKDMSVSGAQNFPYFYTRIQLPGQQLDQLLIQSIKNIAVVRKDKLLVICCTSEFQFIQEQTILQGNTQEVAMLSFGVGGFQNSNNTHLLLVFSQNTKLQYYKGLQIEESYQWLYISSTEFQHKIVDGKFISNNLLIVLTDFQVTICNVSQNPEKIHSFDINKFSYIDFFVQEENLHFDKKLVRKSILRTIKNKNEFFCLQGKRLLTGKIDSWKDYLQRYVNEEKFNQAIVMSLKIYNRELKKLCGINQKQQVRNDEMKQFFEKIALTYVSYEIKKQNFDKLKMLSFCIYYLVKTQCFQYLFTTIYQILKSLNLQEEFLQKIDEYCQKGQIKVMTEQILDRMVVWYKNKYEKDKLQIMVQNFDLSLMEKSVLLFLCLKQHLYESMIYICNQHNDFISPILKLCGIFFTQSLSPQSKQQIKQIVFFYLKQCLLGHNTEYGNSKAYIQMLIQIINFIFIPSTLDMLVGISCADTIKVVNMFFETKILQYILENEGQFFIKKNDYIEMKVFEKGSINQFRVYEKMLSTLLFILDQQEGKKNNQMEDKNHQDKKNEQKPNSQNLNYQVNKFLSFLILKNQFPFELKYKLASIDFFIETLSVQFLPLMSKVSFNESSIIFKQSHDKLKKLASDDLNQVFQKEVEVNAYFMRLMDSLLRSLEQSEEKIKILNEILNKLIGSENHLHLLEGKCYLLNELGKEAEALKNFLRMTNPLTRNKVFEFLEFNLNQSSQLIAQFIISLQLLFALNKQKTHQLLNSLKIQFSDIDNIISNLNSYPDLQLKYIEQILFDQTFKLSESRKNKYALIHLQTVVKHKPFKLDEYIQKIDYPLEEAFKICEEKNNKTAKAYIMIKSGRNMEGLLELCDIFLKTCDQVFGTIARKRPLELQSKINLSEQLNKLLITCQNEFKLDNQKGQKIWEKCIKKIFRHLRISQNIRNQSIPPLIKEILKQIVQNTMKKMFSQMSPDFFVQRFCKKFPQLPFSVFIIAFGQIYDRMQFTSQLQLLELELQQKDEKKTIQNLLKSSLKSHPVWSQCSSCKQNFSSSDKGQWSVITHSCGCNFHKICVQQKSSEKKVEKEKKNKQVLTIVHTCMNDIQSYVEMKGIKLQHYRTDHAQQTAMKKKIVKLQEYESGPSHIFDLPTVFG